MVIYTKIGFISVLSLNFFKYLFSVGCSFSNNSVLILFCSFTFSISVRFRQKILSKLSPSGKFDYIVFAQLLN